MFHGCFSFAFDDFYITHCTHTQRLRDERCCAILRSTPRITVDNFFYITPIRTNIFASIYIASSLLVILNSPSIHQAYATPRRLIGANVILLKTQVPTQDLYYVQKKSGRYTSCKFALAFLHPRRSIYLSGRRVMAMETRQDEREYTPPFCPRQQIVSTKLHYLDCKPRTITV